LSLFLKPSSLATQMLFSRLLYHGQVGTTFLQSSLSSPKLTAVLLKDNYVYLGKCPFRGTCPLPKPKDCKGLFDSLILSSSSKSTNTLPTTSHLNNQTLPRELQDNRSALLVDENLVLENPAIASILKSMYRVRVVLGYRRLYEWLVSEYNQEFKPGGTNKSLACTVWPDQQGKPLLPFDIENRGSFTRQFEYFKRTGRHPTHILKDESYFDDVHIINQHTLVPSPNTAVNHHPTNNVDPLLHHLVCEVMPNTTHSCKAVKNGLKPNDTRSNSYMNFDYDRLAIAAFERGWINTTRKSRAQVIQHIMEYDINAQSQGRIPLANYQHDCLTDEKLEVSEILSFIEAHHQAHTTSHIGLCIPLR
jgi:hypothetical protein